MLHTPVRVAALALLCLVGGCHRREPDASAAAALPPPAGPRALRPLQAFAAIGDEKERSRALFLEMSRVLLHPRCANCHPDGDVPLQGMDMRPHLPPVVRGPEDKGVVGMECQGCHQEKNLAHARVPGAPNWHVAPREMAWVGRTPRQICEQVKDPARNGGKSFAQLVHHNGEDALVGWGWAPGHGREPAPGTQKEFGALTQAWIDTGAECPSEEARP